MRWVTRFSVSSDGRLTTSPTLREAVSTGTSTRRSPVAISGSMEPEMTMSGLMWPVAVAPQMSTHIRPTAARSQRVTSAKRRMSCIGVPSVLRAVAVLRRGGCGGLRGDGGAGDGDDDRAALALVADCPVGVGRDLQLELVGVARPAGRGERRGE